MQWFIHHHILLSLQSAISLQWTLCIEQTLWVLLPTLQKVAIDLLFITHRSLDMMETSNAYTCIFEFVIYYATDECSHPWNDKQIQLICDIINYYHRYNMDQFYQSAQYSKGLEFGFLFWDLVIERIQAVFNKSPIRKVRKCLEIILEDILRLQQQNPNHDFGYIGPDRNERATTFMLHN